MMPSFTIDVPQDILDKLHEAYEFDTVRTPREGELVWCPARQVWQPAVQNYTGIYYIARKARPWYPASWLDDSGNPLPDVHEVTPGEWPPCKPGDEVEFLIAVDRKRRNQAKLQSEADQLFWSSAIDPIVAIRIVRRAGE